MRTRVLLLISIVLIFFLLPHILPPYVVTLMTVSLIYAIAAMSLNILQGYLGLPALGHMTFFAFGAYATGILTSRYHFGFWINLPLSIVAGAIGAAILTPLILRAVKLYFMMITLSIALCVWGLAIRWVDMTGGDNGISGIPRPDLGLSWSMGGTIPFYYLVLIFFLINLGLIFLLIRSPFGTTLVGIRDSESRMSEMGYHVKIHKYLAFIVTAMFAGGAGCVFTYYNRFISPDVINLEHCMKLVLMVALGGPGTVLGPILGAFIIIFAEQTISILTARWLMIIAVLYYLTANLPEGVLGLLFKARSQLWGKTRG